MNPLGSRSLAKAWSAIALAALAAPAWAQDSDADGYADVCEFAYGNFDLDDEVSGADLTALLAQWGQTGAVSGDLDGDGVVAGSDIAVLLGRWGPVDYSASNGPLCWAMVLEAAPDPVVVINASLRDAITATGMPWRVRDRGTQIELLLMPPGTFDMGCSPSTGNCLANENPVHSVTITDAVFIGRYEVTQAQWQGAMGSNPSTFQSGTDAPSRPVEQVSWSMIQGFLTATEMRLPSEAEWEFAYRAGTTTAFHSGPAFPDGTNTDSLVTEISWGAANSTSTHVVGGRAANALGMHDMSGNVREWVSDWYGSTYYASSPEIDPTGPTTGSLRVLRGGSFNDNAYGLRSSYRYSASPGLAGSFIGFRVARNP